MTTISTNHFAGITLSSPGYVNPIVIDPGVTVSHSSGGLDAVVASSGSWTIQNSGTILSDQHYGVVLSAGGSVTNAASALITGAQGGVLVPGITGGSAGTVVNSGSIAATSGFGIDLRGSGSVTNATSASITGTVGVYMRSGGTLTNAGTIEGTGGRAVYFVFGANDRLVVDPGAVFSGGVIFNPGGSNVLELASGDRTGTLSGLGTSFVNFGAVAVDSGASWSLTGANTVAAGTTLTDNGTLTDAGRLTNAGGISGAVTVAHGDVLTNLSSGVIADFASAAVYGAGGSGAVVNSGSIAGNGFTGILLSAGGSVTNAAAASIAGGHDGVYINVSAGTVVNSGRIAATRAGSYGVLLNAGGAVTNAAAASITGGFGGVFIFNSAGTVVNYGSIAGTRSGSYGVFLNGGGSVTNAASASITGAGGAYLYAGGTLTNAGTITGSGGTAVTFGGTASDRLVVDPGAVFNGSVEGSTSGSNALELASAESTGTLSGLGTSFANFESVTVDSGASWELTGADTIASGGTLVNSGTLTLSGATLSDSGGLVNNGGLVLDPSTLTVANMSGSGSVVISSGSILNVGSGLATNVTVSGGGMLVVSSGATASGTVVSSGGAVDVLDGGTLAGNVVNNGTVNYDITSGAAFSGTLTGSGTLVVSGGGALDVVSAYTGTAQIDDASTLEFTSAYVGVTTFSGSPTGSGGTLKLDVPSTGPINVVNPNDTVIAQPGGNNWINAAISYTLPANIDALFLYAGSHGTGNSDASGDALYALDAGNAQTLTGNSPNDTFVVYNSSDVVVPKAGSHDVVYAAASYALPTGVDVLILEASANQGVGNSDAAGDALYAANPNQVATLTGNSANDTFVVYNSADVVVPKTGSHDLVYAAVNYTLPTSVNSLILEAGTQAVGNSDAAGDTLYAANAGIAQTLTGNSHNDTFVVYNAGDTVIGQTGSTDTVYAAANFTLPSNVDTLFLEGPGATLGTGNNDAVNALFGNGGVASTLVAGSGADTLYVTGTAGTVLTGGTGHDTFAFPNAMGDDTVTNFAIAKDTLQFNTTLFANFTAAMNAASQVGGNTVFTIDTNDTVTLDSVTKSSLTAGNFHFS